MLLQRTKGGNSILQTGEPRLIERKWTEMKCKGLRDSGAVMNCDFYTCNATVRLWRQ